MITFCEIKYLSEKVPTALIREFENKLATTTVPKDMTIEKVIISNQEPEKGLQDSGYFHSFLTAEQILKHQFY